MKLSNENQRHTFVLYYLMLYNCLGKVLCQYHDMRLGAPQS